MKYKASYRKDRLFILPTLEVARLGELKLLGEVVSPKCTMVRFAWLKWDFNICTEVRL